jgi:selenocysteine lyase/cysteine desulfurase
MRKPDFWDFVRTQTIGRDTTIRTPFGERRLTYVDYTASGQGVSFIEEYLTSCLATYGNTHTEDDLTGSITTARMHLAEQTIKRLVNADENYRVIFNGFGMTGAVNKLQEILGIYLPPAGKAMYSQTVREVLPSRQQWRFLSSLEQRRPVVFVGPYEHHSNEISWRECFAEVIEIELNDEGEIDLQDLKRRVSDKSYRNRWKIGAFSAASNVTGIKTPVYKVARILHEHNALAFFDYAAIAPYTCIDVRNGADCYFDGVYFSPHKFLGGPGSTGVLIIHKRIYHEELPPTRPSGGTVEYVSAHDQDYVRDIETREKPGTPGVLQILKAALTMELAERLDYSRIEKRENELIRRALNRFAECPDIEVLGNLDHGKRAAICSFNIRMCGGYLHPRFVVRLMNDLFGIQSRAGCSCAGPYGHRLLSIDRKKSDAYRRSIMRHQFGVKPGWVRVGFHFLMTDEEFDFVCAAIRFVAELGKYFLQTYFFDQNTGQWLHKRSTDQTVLFGVDSAINRQHSHRIQRPKGKAVPYGSYLTAARREAKRLKNMFEQTRLRLTDEELIPFVYSD